MCEFTVVLHNQVKHFCWSIKKNKNKKKTTMLIKIRRQQSIYKHIHLSFHSVGFVGNSSSSTSHLDSRRCSSGGSFIVCHCKIWVFFVCFFSNLFGTVSCHPTKYYMQTAQFEAVVETRVRSARLFLSRQRSLQNY